MNTTVEAILAAAADEGRETLFEHEVYGVLGALGIATPRAHFLGVGEAHSAAALRRLRELGDRIVLKVVSEKIAHKSDVGGVREVESAPAHVEAAVGHMLDEVPRRFLESHPGRGDPSIRGVLAVEKVDFARAGLGSELFVSYRQSREFGPVLTLGVGGVETEWIGAACRRGRAVISQSLDGADPETLLRGFEGSLALDRLLGRVRGARPLVERAALLDLLRGFLRLSSAAPDRFEVIELEVNPFAVSRGKLVALDGLSRFGHRRAPRAPAPIESIERLLRPRSAALIGASAKGRNMGRIILGNMIDAGFDRARLYAIRPGIETLDGVRCVPAIADLPERVDLLIVAVGAAQVPGLIEEIVESERAIGVILIPGGMGEKAGGEELERAVKEAIARARAGGHPLAVNGGNCLGIVSRPGHYHTLFIPREKLPLRARADQSGLAIVSQSGAYLISRLSKIGGLSPRYAISVGNQVDLTVTDHVRALLRDPEVTTIALYVEGFQDGDGRALCRAIGEARATGRDVIFYKAGRTAEGQRASAGHTASLAGDYELSVSLVERAGALLARDFDEFLDLIKVSAFLGRRRWRARRPGTPADLSLAALTNAGYEAVGISDALRGADFEVRLARFSAKTEARLQAALADFHLDALVDVHNPFDLTPMAGDEAHEAVMRAFIEEEDVDAILCATVPLTPAMDTLFADDTAAQSDAAASSLIGRLARLRAETDKPIAVSIDAGHLFDPMARAIEALGLPVFRSADRAVRALGRYARQKGQPLQGHPPGWRLDAGARPSQKSR